MKLDPDMHIGLHLVFFGKSDMRRGKSPPQVWCKKQLGSQKLAGKQAVALINVAVALVAWRIVAGMQTCPWSITRNVCLVLPPYS
jgi:hypothetical protein